MDFGNCQVNKEKSVAFQLQNVVNTEMPVVVHMLSSDTSDQYQLSQSQFSINANGTTTVKVGLLPLKQGHIEDKLAVVSIGGELRVVEVHAYVGPVIEVQESVVDFGRIQIDTTVPHDVVLYRRIHIRNVTREPAHIMLRSTINEVEIEPFDRSHPRAVTLSYVIPPKSTVRFRLMYAPTTPGMLAAKVAVTVANQPTMYIALYAEVATLTLGCQSDLVLPLTRVQETSTIDFPILWVGPIPQNNVNVQAKVQLDPKLPISLRLPRELELTSQYDKETGELTFPLENVVVLQVVFSPISPGSIHAPVTISAGGMIIEASINAICPPGTVPAENILSAMRRFMLRPSVARPVEFPGTRPASRPLESESAFEFSPRGTVLLLGSEEDGPMPSADAEQAEVQYRQSRRDAFPKNIELKLRNISMDASQYHIIMCGPLETDAQLDGELPPQGELEFSVRLDDRILRPGLYYKSEDEFIPMVDESQRWTTASISVLDQNGGVKSLSLAGILEEAMRVECRQFDEQDIPKVLEVQAVTGFGKKDTRVILLRNHSGRDVTWNGKIYTYRGPLLPTGEEPSTPPTKPLEKEEQQIMKLNIDSGLLKPFETFELTIECTAGLSGEYSGKLWIDYNDFSEPDSTVLRLSQPTLIRYSAGSTDVTFVKEALVVGNAAVGQHLTPSIELKNNSTMACRNIIVQAKTPLAIADHAVDLLPSSIQKINLDFLASMEKFATAMTLDFAHEQFFKSIPVIFNQGILDLRCNLISECLPISKMPLPRDLLYDFGTLQKQHSKTVNVVLLNNGTMSFTLSSVTSPDPLMRIKMVSQRAFAIADRVITLDDFEANMVNDGTRPEVDFDELEDNRGNRRFPGKQNPQADVVEKWSPQILHPGQTVVLSLTIAGFDVHSYLYQRLLSLFYC